LKIDILIKKLMKKIVLLLVAFLFISPCFAAVEAEDEYIYVSEVNTLVGSEIIIPDDINWTQRFILTELKELRTQLESTRRELNEQLNARELASVDRALSYNANTVNFLWIIITIAVTGFGLVGWRTMKDVKENLSNNFEKEVQKRIKLEQKKLEVFMEKFEVEQLQQSKVILQNQEFIQKKQEAGYIWSQYNREENPSSKLELLEKITWVGLEEDEILIYIERSWIYVELALWDKVVESTDKWLEISPDNTTLLYNKASALVMLEQTDDATKLLYNVIWVNPGMKEEILEDPMFENIWSDLEEYISNQVV
jgi:tetratricopeptide (TPR) repeat protein